MKIENLELRRINKVLLGVFLFLLGWFLLDVFLNLGNSRLTTFNFRAEDSENERGDNFKKIPAFSRYAKVLNKRQLFKGKSVEERAASPESYDDSSRILISDFQLVGIAAGTNPQAIIQNKKTKQTYFLYKGQGQDNLKVEDILENKVKLNYNGESFELFL